MLLKQTYTNPLFVILFGDNEGEQHRKLTMLLMQNFFWSWLLFFVRSSLCHTLVLKTFFRRSKPALLYLNPLIWLYLSLKYKYRKHNF